MERYLADPFHAAAVDQQKLLDRVERETAKHRKGGTKGRTNKKTELVRAHIRELQAKHPSLTSPTQLFQRRDRAITGDMALKTFAHHVRALREK